MMLLSLLLALHLGTHCTDGASLYQEASALMSDLKKFRRNLVDGVEDMPSDFFDLELAVTNLDLENSSALMEKILGFRQELTKMTATIQEKLFDIEYDLNAEFDVSDSDGCANWRLAMNINPDDGHTMGYGTGWGSTASIGTEAEALGEDYKNQEVWAQPASYISIVRHQSGIIDAVKVFKLVNHDVSLFTMFSSNAVGAAYSNAVVTRGGPIHFNKSAGAQHMTDDPIFSAGGDLLFNWFANANDGVRITMTGITHLYTKGDKFHGIGGNYVVASDGSLASSSIQYEQDVDVLCPTISQVCRMVQGGDHGTYSGFVEQPVHGNYAIYVSQYATRFLNPGQELQPEIESCE